MNLAIFFNEFSFSPEMLHSAIITPILRYQRELAATGTTVFAGAERFQCKLLSTKNTFAGHPDWGGYVCLIGEFDQIRLRNGTNAKTGRQRLSNLRKAWGGRSPYHHQCRVVCLLSWKQRR
jgi:hypothetical protein